MDGKESLRLKIMSKYEKSLLDQGITKIAGVDEAGRGPLAGPVVAAACMFNHPISFSGLNDSKLLSKVARERLYHELIQHSDVFYAVAIIDREIIDKINILQASLYAMKKAVEKLTSIPQYLLIDGNKLPDIPIPKQAIIKGDSLSVSIAAASIIAKYTRDAYMIDLHKKWPIYGFDSHKGYGTKKHLQMLNKHGPCIEHRRSFNPVKDLLHTNLLKKFP